MPSADFCSAVRPPFDNLSPLTDTKQISWGKLSRLPCTVAESTLRTLMDMDVAVSCPLVLHWRLVSGSCPSTRTFDPCFFRTPPRGGSPCIITRPSPPSGWPEDFHLQTAEHARHTASPLPWPHQIRRLQRGSNLHRRPVPVRTPSCRHGICLSAAAR